MPNRCTEIRKIIEESLSVGNEFKDKIFNCRYTPVQKDKHFPSISILTPREKVDILSKKPKLFERETEVLIILFTRQSQYYADNRDDIMQYIEGIINNINHKDFEFEYNGFETDVDIDMSHSSVITTISYKCFYNTSETEDKQFVDLNKLSLEVTNA